MKRDGAKFYELNLMVPRHEYLRFTGIKRELEEQMGEIPEEYVLYKLLTIHKEYKAVLEENKKLKRILKRYLQTEYGKVR